MEDIKSSWLDTFFTKFILRSDADHFVLIDPFLSCLRRSPIIDLFVLSCIRHLQIIDPFSIMCKAFTDRIKRNLKIPKGQTKIVKSKDIQDHLYKSFNDNSPYWLCIIHPFIINPFQSSIKHSFIIDPFPSCIRH